MRLIALIFGMLTPVQRRRYLLLQGYFIFVALIQVIGAVSVAPFIALLSNPSIIHTNAYVSRVYDGLNVASDKQFLLGFAVVLMLLIIVSNAVMALATWMSVSFSLRLGLEIQRDIYHGVMHRDFVEMSRSNTSDLIASITQNAPRFTYMVVQPLLNLTSQAIIVLLIAIGLLWYDPRVALFATVLVGGGYLTIYSMFRQQLASHGRQAWLGHQAKQRILAESLGGLKEIRLLGTEQRYEDELHEVTERTMRSDRVVGLLGEVPRFVLESLAFSAVLGLGIYLLIAAEKPQDIVGVLSLYAMAGYKLLPAAQSVFRTGSQIRANMSIIERIQPDVIAGRAVQRAAHSAADVVAMPVGDIAFEGVRFTYPGVDRPVLDGVSFTIPRNTITVLVGESGAGKSTIADIILGLLHPDAGVITVGNLPIAENIKGWQRNLGYVPQHIFLLDDTVAANIGLGSLGEVDAAKVRKAASLAHIDRFVESLSGQYEYVVGERGSLLSGGQRQRVGIARALYHDAQVLVMDEATSALDSITEREFIATLGELKQSKTIVMIAHRLSTIKCADQVIFMHRGGVLTGTFQELSQSSADFRAIVLAGSGSRPAVVPPEAAVLD